MSSNNEKIIKDKIIIYKKKSLNSLKKVKNITKGRNLKNLPKNIRQRALMHLKTKKMYNSQVFRLEKFLKNIEKKKQKVRKTVNQSKKYKRTLPRRKKKISFSNLKSTLEGIDRRYENPSISISFDDMQETLDEISLSIPSPTPSLPSVSQNNLQRRLNALKRTSPITIPKSTSDINLSNLQRRLNALKRPSPVSIPKPTSDINLSNLQRRLNALKRTSPDPISTNKINITNSYLQKRLNNLRKTIPTPIKYQQKTGLEPVFISPLQITPKYLKYRPPTPPKKKRKSKLKKIKSVRPRFGKSLKSFFTRRNRNVFV